MVYALCGIKVWYMHYAVYKYGICTMQYKSMVYALWSIKVWYMHYEV